MSRFIYSMARHGLRLFTFCTTAVVLACVVLASPAGAQQAEDRVVAERLVKAAYLYKFGSYVTWPERAFPKPESPLKIGIVGDDELADELAHLAEERTLNGRRISVYRIQPEQARSQRMNVLFIGGNNIAQITDTLAAIKGQPVLTITEVGHALDLGSMINFVVVDGKLRFEVSPKAAGAGNLAMSPALFPVAHRVASLAP